MRGNTIKAGTTLMKSPGQAIRGRDAHGHEQAWPGWCLSAAGRFVGWPGGADTAGEAYRASRIVDTDPATAPAGAPHWWTDAGAGHVSVSLGAGETFMASGWVTREHGTVWHPGLGVVDVAAYSRAHPALTYRGWSADLAGVVMADTVVLLRVPGERAVWRLTTDLTRRHVLRPEYALLKHAGHRPVLVSQARLESFRRA